MDPPEKDAAFGENSRCDSLQGPPAIPEWYLTPTGRLYAESQLFRVIPHEGITKKDLQKKVGLLIYDVGMQQALNNEHKWLKMEGELIRKETVEQMRPDDLSLKRKRSGSDLTLENIQRDDSKELGFEVVNSEGGLHEMLKGLPTYLLFESTSGYALLLAHGLHEIGRNFEAVEKYISRFEVFKLVAFHPFESADEALTQINAIANGTVTDQLKSFLVRSLPKPVLEDGSPAFALAVSDPSMMHEICAKSKITHACRNSVFFRDVMRGVRMHIDKFLKDLQLGDFKKAQIHLARRYSRQKAGIN